MCFNYAIFLLTNVVWIRSRACTDGSTGEPTSLAKQHYIYGLRSEGDNVLGSVRLSPLPRLNRLTYDLNIRYVG